MSKSWFEERKNCPACASEEITIRYQAFFSEQPIKQYLIDFYSPQGGVEFEYLKDEEYVLCDCGSCGMIFQKKIPNSDLMERLYEHWIDPTKAFENSKLKRSKVQYAYYAKEIMTIGSCFKANPSDIKFLDFGMGWSDWLLMANGFGYECFGVELSENRIKYAASRGIKVLGWEQAEKLCFDFINTEQVFEHIPEPLETLKKLKKILKPGGLIKISVPTVGDIDRLLKKMDWKAKKGTQNSLNPVAPLEHIQYFKRSSLTQMAEMAGMTEFLIPLNKQWNSSFDWFHPKNFVRNALIPLHRNLLRKQNYIFLTSK